MPRIRNWFDAFLFVPDSDRWLALLRVGLGFQVALFCLSLENDWNELFGGEGSGFIGRDLTEAIVSIKSPFVPKLGWLVAMASHLGLGEQRTLSLVWFALLCTGCCLFAGLFSRVAAIAAWFLHLAAVKSGNFLAYGMDNFTTIGLFYLMLAPLPDRYGLDARIWPAPHRDARILGFFHRVLQLHLCVIYFFAGLTKSLGAGWWTGASLWRALTRPPFDIIPARGLMSWEAVLPAFGIAVCLIEIGYPIFIWWRRTRLIWLILILAMHIGIALAMGLYLFSSIMIILNVAAFGPGLTRSEQIEPNSIHVPRRGSLPA
jgi:hypothetical protein